MNWYTLCNDEASHESAICMTGRYQDQPLPPEKMNFGPTGFVCSGKVRCAHADVGVVGPVWGVGHVGVRTAPPTATKASLVVPTSGPQTELYWLKTYTSAAGIASAR